jgi:hypothetical protein
MSDPNLDPNYRDTDSSGPFWAAMAILGLFLLGAFLYFAPRGDMTAMNAPSTTGAGSESSPAGGGKNPTGPSTTGSGSPSR